MLTSLYIHKKTYNSKMQSLCAKLLGNKMKVEIRQAGNIQIKCVEYINRTGRTNYNKLDKIIGAQRNRLLCPHDTILSKELGYRRFESSEFKRRLCTNTAISLLSLTTNSSISVGLLDMDASFALLPKYLLKYTDNVVVVTNEQDIYSEVAESLLHDTGAPIRLSKTVRSLDLCDLIIAPNGLEPNINAKPDSLVLTDRKPQKTLAATTIYGYDIELSDELDFLRPQWLDKTYFASALYTLGRIYDLGAVVPAYCLSSDKIHTISSLTSLLNKSTAKT